MRRHAPLLLAAALVLTTALSAQQPNWTQRKPRSSPPARMGHAMAYDAARQRSVLFGGFNWNMSRFYADTWEWNGKSWTQIKPATSPSPRAWHAMAYDAARQRGVLFGGWDPRSRKTFSDTWEYGGPYLTLTTNTSTVSLAARGVQNFTLDAGTQHKNKVYFLLGTLSGTTPGIPLAPKLTLPLNLDGYLNLTLAFPNVLLLMNSLGTLDAKGQATAKWSASPLIPPALVGKLFHHAYVVIGNSPFEMASNAVPLRLLK